VYTLITCMHMHSGGRDARAACSAGKKERERAKKQKAKSLKLARETDTGTSHELAPPPFFGPWAQGKWSWACMGARKLRENAMCAVRRHTMSMTTHKPARARTTHEHDDARHARTVHTPPAWSGPRLPRFSRFYGSHYTHTLEDLQRL